MLLFVWKELKKMNNGEKYGLGLLKEAGRVVYCNIVNLLNLVQSDRYHYCFCVKYDACPPNPYSTSTYACELCQLHMDFCLYYFEKELKNDPAKLIKYAVEIYDRCREIGAIRGERAVECLRGVYEYNWKNYQEGTVTSFTIYDVLEPNDMF